MNVIIIDGGETGSYIGRLLSESRINIKIIESDESVFERLIIDFSREKVIFGSGTDPSTLESAGIQSADVLVTVTGSDEVNLVASTIAKFEFTIPKVVARVNNPRNTWLYTQDMGVDVSINQPELISQIVMDEMDMDHIATLMKLNRGNFSIAKVTVNAKSNAVSKMIKELDIPVGCVLIAILRDEDQVIIPRGDTFIRSGDHILLLADRNSEKPANDIFYR